MEASRLAVRGDDAIRLADAFLERKATERRHSINKRGVRNIHRYSGDGFTHVAYERAAAHESSWVTVSVLVEQKTDREATVVLLVGGGGRGPFKLEEVTLRRIVRGETAVGQAGRFVSVLEEIRQVCESLDLDVEPQWSGDSETNLYRKLGEKIFGS